MGTEMVKSEGRRSESNGARLIRSAARATRELSLEEADRSTTAGAKRSASARGRG